MQYGLHEADQRCEQCLRRCTVSWKVMNITIREARIFLDLAYKRVHAIHADLVDWGEIRGYVISVEDDTYLEVKTSIEQPQGIRIQVIRPTQAHKFKNPRSFGTRLGRGDGYNQDTRRRPNAAAAGTPGESGPLRGRGNGSEATQGFYNCSHKIDSK